VVFAESFLQAGCISLSMLAIGLILIELRCSLERSFLYFGIVLILLCSFCAADLWGNALNSSVKLIVLQHLAFCFVPPFYLRYLTLLGHQRQGPTANRMLYVATALSLLFLSGVMFRSTGVEVKPSMLYLLTFGPYLLFSIAVLLSRPLLNLSRSGARERGILIVHFVGFLFLACCGLVDMTQLMRGPIFRNPTISFTIIGVLGLGVVFAFVFTERLILLIRERLMFIDKLQGAYKELDQVRSLTEIGKSTAIINHEIKNYTCVIAGYSQYLLMKAELSETFKDMLNKIIDTATKLSEFSNEILDFSKAKILSDKKPLSIGSLIRKCVDVNFQEKQASFSFVGFDAEPTIHGDWRKLEQVFMNLFKNALEAGATSVRIKLVPSDFVLLVSVEDDGVGCNATQYKKLFEAFHTTKDAGTGLGLVTSRSIIETHGGSVSVVSKNLVTQGAHGLTFRIVFPTFETSREDTKDNVVFVKDGIENLALVIAVFRNVRVNPHVIDSIDDIKDLPMKLAQPCVVAGPRVVAELMSLRATYQCYSLVTTPDGIVRVVGSPPDKYEGVFSEEFVLQRVLTAAAGIQRPPDSEIQRPARSSQDPDTRPIAVEA